MMTLVIFTGDLLVMAFMIGVVIWVLLGMSDSEVDKIARLPLQDDSTESDDHG